MVVISKPKSKLIYEDIECTIVLPDKKTRVTKTLRLFDYGRENAKCRDAYNDLCKMTGLDCTFTDPNSRDLWFNDHYWSWYNRSGANGKMTIHTYIPLKTMSFSCYVPPMKDGRYVLYLCN